MNEQINSTVEEQQPVYNIRHRAFYFSKNILEFIGNAKYEWIHYSLFDQLLRAATSVGANLAEGSAGVSNKDYIHYNAIALKSSNETKYWLCLIKEAGLANKNKLDELNKRS
jgi:four helix bundle protein